jgi:hypothetical protein
MKEQLSDELKQKIVDEVNSDIEPEQPGNTSLFTMGSLEELKPFLKELTPLEMFDKSVAINQTTIANLADILPKLSKKNIIKLFFATLKLPEQGASLKFGGKQQDQQMCEVAYANSQMARNALVHVLGTSAIAQARLVKSRELKEQEADSQEINQSEPQAQGENNE